jgi:ribosomal protein S18 acetylase RimI-like enzyme
MTDAILRPARHEDTEFLIELFLKTMRESITGARGYWDPAKERKQFREQLDLGRTRIIQSHQRDVGFVTAQQVGAALTRIGTLCISVEHQGAGIGTSIMRLLMRTAELEQSDLELFVLTANPRARRLYERLGFCEAEETPHHKRMRWRAPKQG